MPEPLSSIDQKSVESQLAVDQDVNRVLTKVSMDCQFSIDLTLTEGQSRVDWGYQSRGSINTQLQMPLTEYMIQQLAIRANLCGIQASLGAI